MVGSLGCRNCIRIPSDERHIRGTSPAATGVATIRASPQLLRAWRTMTDERTTTMPGTSPRRRLTGSPLRHRVAPLVGVLACVALTACSSTAGRSTSSTTGAAVSTGRSIPASAFSDTTGLTSTTVSIGNVSTLSLGLFKGALIGTQAYADYVNSRGGVNGRKIRVD